HITSGAEHRHARTDKMQGSESGNEIAYGSKHERELSHSRVRPLEQDAILLRLSLRVRDGIGRRCEQGIGLEDGCAKRTPSLAGLGSARSGHGERSSSDEHTPSYVSTAGFSARRAE